MLYHNYLSLIQIQHIFLYDRVTNRKLIDLDYIDPLYGKIPGPAEAEIFYKTLYDPAVYNHSGATGTVDATNSWTDTQIGRLWWDLRTAVYYYPYQSNIIFNNSYWNKLFPGATIDVHEWTESTRTPTEWNTLSANENYYNFKNSILKFFSAIFSKNKPLFSPKSVLLH